MKKFPLLLCLAAGWSAASFAHAAPDSDPAAPVATTSATPATDVFYPGEVDRMRPKIGQQVVIEGMPIIVGENKTGTVRYLNFARDYKTVVSIILTKEHPAVFLSKDELKLKFLGKKVRVTGTLEEANGALQINLSEPGQIQVL